MAPRGRVAVKVKNPRTCGSTEIHNDECAAVSFFLDFLSHLQILQLVLLFPSTIQKNTPPPYYIPIIVCLHIVLTTWHNDSKVQNRNCAAASSETFPPQALSEHIVSTHWWEWTYWASQQIRSANIAFRSKMSCRTPLPPPPPPPPSTPPRTQLALVSVPSSPPPTPEHDGGYLGLSPCPLHPPSASFPSRIRTGLLSHTSPSPHYLTCNIIWNCCVSGLGGGGGGLKWFVLFAAVSLFRDNTWLCKCTLRRPHAPFTPLTLQDWISLVVFLETFYRSPPWLDYSWLSRHPLLWFCQEPWINSWLKTVHEEARHKNLPNFLFLA